MVSRFFSPARASLLKPWSPPFDIESSLLLAVHLVVGTTEELLYLHLALKLHHAIEDSLWTWRTARNVNVYRNNLRDTAHHIVGVLERTARDGATAYSYNILRLSHLVVETLEDRSHLVGDSTGTHDEVSLTCESYV